MRAVSPEASEQESRAVFPEHAAERRPRLGHRRAGRGAAALRPQGQRGGGLRPGAQPERPPMAHRSERVVPSRAAPSRAQPSLAEPCGSKASRAVSSRAEPGGTCGVGLSVRPQERLCPLLPLMRAALTKPRSGACTHAHSHTRTRAHTRTDTLTPGGCGNGPPRRLLRVPTHSVPLSPVSPPCPRCPRRVPSMSPLSPCRGDAGALCPRSGVPGVSDARRGAHCLLWSQSSWESRSPYAFKGPSVLGMMVFPLFPEHLRVPLSLEARTVPCVPQSSQKFPHPLCLPRFPLSLTSPDVPTVPCVPSSPTGRGAAHSSTVGCGLGLGMGFISVPPPSPAMGEWNDCDDRDGEPGEEEALPTGGARRGRIYFFSFK